MNNTIFSCLTLFLSAVCSVSCLAQADLPLKDISGDSARQVVIAQGTPTLYQGHPYSLLMPDGKTIFCVWCINHGGFAGPLAISEDGGLSWAREDKRMAPEYSKHKNCPSIFRLVNANGNAFLWTFSAQPQIARTVSADEGKTWAEKEPLGFPNVMAFSSIVSKNPGVQDGKYIGFYHQCVNLDTGAVLTGESCKNRHLEVVQSETSDAGFTWSAPCVVASVEGKDACEPFAFWSPDNKEICCLMRENRGAGGELRRALQMFSSDNGQTWSAPIPTCWGLTGHRHMGTYAKDGRLVISFRDTAPGSSTEGSFVAWVGTYDDIKSGRVGQYRVKLLHSYAGWDCGYPGIHTLTDGTIAALTYIKYKNDENKHSVVATRFTMAELDNLKESETK